MELLRNEKAINYIHATLILGAMSSLVGLLGWSIAGTLGLLWALFLGAVVLIFSAKLSTARMLKFYGALPLSQAQFVALHSAVDILSARANLPVKPHLYYVANKVANAFAIGSKRQPAVIVTDGLLRSLNLQEILAVVAHEISHIKHNDLWLVRLAKILGRLTIWLCIIGQLLLLINLPSLMLGEKQIPWLAVILLMISPTTSKLLEMALARRREIDADLDGVVLSGDPLALASALRKMKSEDSSLVGKILGRGKKYDQALLWRTHPHTSDRIERILSLLRQGEIDGMLPKPSRLNQLNREIKWCHDDGC